MQHGAGAKKKTYSGAKWRMAVNEEKGNTNNEVEKEYDGKDENDKGALD